MKCTKCGKEEIKENLLFGLCEMCAGEMSDKEYRMLTSDYNKKLTK